MSNRLLEDPLQAWRESARFWNKHSDTVRAMFAPITAAMAEEAVLAPGRRVLDVAAGPGEPSLTVAQLVGPAGSVTCTDAVSEMVAMAKREALARGLFNIDFVQCAADAVPFRDECFDAVVCRLGVMLFGDPIAALREMIRVAQPGGCLSFAVWHRREDNPFFQIPLEILSRYVEMAEPDPNLPGAFRFAEIGALAGVLENVGAVNVKERVLKFHLEAPISVKEFWPMRSELSDTLREKLAALSPEQLLRIAVEVQESVGSFFAAGKMSFPAQVIVVTGWKRD